MTQSIESMIEVLQAYQAGKKIEYFSNMECKWLLCEVPPIWAFNTIEYRIAPEPKKKVKLEAYIACDELRWFLHGTIAAKHWTRFPSEDKEIEL